MHETKNLIYILPGYYGNSKDLKGETEMYTRKIVNKLTVLQIRKGNRNNSEIVPLLFNKYIWRDPH